MQEKWWKEGIVYQIYPMSFYDSNGDGIGDIPGIIAKVDYIASLGVDIIWLNPVYSSPGDDNGYDISNYYTIMDEFGTMEQWEELLKALHGRGIRLIMDLVVNHTSDEHQWFVKARSSKENPYRDYYIWRKGKDGKAPNNWRSFFGGSTWEYDKTTDEYYLHLFSKKQPDLNWENPKVRGEIYTMMRWWLDKGIDGFRMDVINLISKAPDLPDGPDPDDDELAWGGEYFSFGPHLNHYLKEMREETFSRYDTFAVGEGAEIKDFQALQLVEEKNRELDMVFHFDHMVLDLDNLSDRFSSSKWDLVQFKEIFAKWHNRLYKKGWYPVFLGNHDFPRMISRFGDTGTYHRESATMLLTLLLTLPGTPYIYMGDEIGMTNPAFERTDQYRDVESLNYIRYLRNKGLSDHDIIERVKHKSRDNARTPIQWNSSANGGFTSGTPWIDIAPNYKTVNIEEQTRDPHSILSHFKKLTALRKKEKLLPYGNFEILDIQNKSTFSYLRYNDSSPDKGYLICLNFTHKSSTISFEKKIEPVLTNYDRERKDIFQGKIELAPYEAAVFTY